MDAQRERFVSGAVERKIAKPTADAIFDACAKFAEYGFNKSHSAPYALLSYQTAWLKANYPVEFLAASMTLDKSNTDKLAEFCNEARRLNIKVLPPSVQTSGADFEPAECKGEPAIRYALSAIKGVGESHARSLAAINGSAEISAVGQSATPAFRDLTQFASKLNPREINKRTLESLAAAGAFDDLEPNRARVHAAAESILAAAHRREAEQLAGQSVLFGGESADAIALPKAEPWPLNERLRREFDSVGFFLSGHPLDAYAAILARLRVQPWPCSSRGQAGRLCRTACCHGARPSRKANQVGHEDGDRPALGSVRPI